MNLKATEICNETDSTQSLESHSYWEQDKNYTRIYAQKQVSSY